MLAKGDTRIVCDRCGRSEAFAIDDDERIGFAYFQSRGWSVRDGKELCPDCTKRYDSLIRDFFKFIT